MRRRPLRLIGLVVISIVLTSCTGQRAVTSGEYTIYVHGRSLVPRGGMDALIEGRLATRDGCVVLESEDRDLWYPVVWPAGTSIASSRPLAVRLPSGVVVAVSEKVSGGGGYLGPERVEPEIPPECLPETNEIAVFNPDDNPAKG